MVILTNAPGLPARWKARDGAEGETAIAESFRRALPLLKRSDLVLVNSDPRMLLELAALFTLLPFLRRPLVGSDIVLRKPERLPQRLLLPAKRFLLSRVDHFLHPFKDLSGYRKYFGIGAERSSYLAFKPNLRYRFDRPPDPDGEYVLCFGRSMRDFDTFFDAVERLPYPAAIARPDFAQLRAHGSRFSRPLDRLPPQVRLLDHDPNDYASQAEVLGRARLVVVPLLESCIVWAATPYNAMLLGKCVIVTEGPSTRGLYTDEVIAVPPEDAGALARAIERAWENRELREKTAAAGYRHVLALGGEPEMAQRMIDLSVAWYHKRRGGKPC